MKLHGDTGFVPENQEMRFGNGCIINWLDGIVEVNSEVVKMARRAGEAGLSGLPR
jgi:hypothetical protein